MFVRDAHGLTRVMLRALQHNAVRSALGEAAQEQLALGVGVREICCSMGGYVGVFSQHNHCIRRITSHINVVSPILAACEAGQFVITL